MNCRRTRSLLSAYIDAELTGFDMLQIRDHISRCSECGAEHESLVSVKRMLSALPDKSPRPEFVAQLQAIAPKRPVDDLFTRVIPMWLATVNSAIATATLPNSGRRVATACLFSLVGVWFMVAPNANAPQSQMLARTHSRAERLLNAVGFATPAYGSGWRLASMSPSIFDPTGGSDGAGNARMAALNAQVLAETRSQSIRLLTRPQFFPGIESPSTSNFGGANMVMTGYSVASR